MSEALIRLIEYPHSPVFDKESRAALALRVRHPAGLVLEVAGGLLRLHSGDSVREYELSEKTIGQLADQLRVDGFNVAFENPDLSGRSAHVLMPGMRDQDESNGDHLQAYTSLLWCLYDAYGADLDDASYQLGQALRQMVLTQAEAEWLDVWAGLYGVPRLLSETDDHLQDRIPQEVFRLRVNGLAIEQAVLDVSGQHVRIDEPWKRMFVLDVSPLSGADHLHDGTYYTYHVIHPVGTEGTDWSKALPVILRNKAAGVDVYSPIVNFSTREINVQPPVEYRIERGQDDLRGSSIWGAKDMILGEMRLSDHEITINHPCSRHDEWICSSGAVVLFEGLHLYDGEATYCDPHDEIHVGLQSHQQLGPVRSVAMASIQLSGGDVANPAAVYDGFYAYSGEAGYQHALIGIEALGNENAVLGRGIERVDFDPDPVLSGLMFLSDYEATYSVDKAENITIETHHSGAASSFAGGGEVQQIDVRASSSNEAYLMRTWTGAWDSATWLPDWRFAGSSMTTETTP